jgi:hypothetical protein
LASTARVPHTLVIIIVSIERVIVRVIFLDTEEGRLPLLHIVIRALVSISFLQKVIFGLIISFKIIF